MNKEIRPKGLTLSPDDRAATPGELAICANVELHDGTLRPSFVDGTEVKTLSVTSGSTTTVHTLIYVHEGASYTNYITTVDSNIYYWRKADPPQTSPTQISGVTGTIKDISSVGNTLCIVTTTGIHYILFKDGTYKYLGTQPPFVDIQFSLTDYEYTGSTIQMFGKAASEMFDLDNQVTTDEGINIKVAVKEEYRAEFTENAYALVNRVHSEITDSGHFYAPFYIRYCLRLYDGTSLVRHSPPVLMPVCIGREDYIWMKGLSVDLQKYKIEEAGTNEMQLQYIAAKLKYKAIGNGWTQLKTYWSDIVTSIDVFISAPITRTQQGELIKFVGLLPDFTYELRNGEFKRWMSSRFINTNVYAHMSELGEESYREKLSSPDVFFKIASFGFNHDMPTDDFRDFPVQGSTLAALSAQEHMKDDYRSHHLLQADSSANHHSFVYNSRLHIYAAEENLFSGFSLSTMLPYITGNTQSALLYNNVYVKIATDDGIKVVKVTGNGYLNDNVMKMIPMFYPDSRAIEMTVTNEITSGGVTTVQYGNSLTMTRLPLLEGARTIGEHADVQEAPEMTAGKIVPSPNKIYVSELRNPFFFPLEARQTVGVGTIYGLGVATRAISPGQFGQHDLMVFCSDGIWALTVNRKTGTYSDSHNVSREVCSNPKSICQLDQSIVFATSRGLSRIVEQDAVSLSDALHGPIIDISKLQSFLDEFSTGGAFVNADIVTLLNFSTSPVDAFQDATALYDYAKERLILVPSSAVSAQPAYVLSLRDGSWSTILLPAIKAVVNAYPHPYVELSDGKLLILDNPFGYESSQSTTSAIIVSRTLSFADTMQVIQGFQQMNDCGTGRVPVIFLYGSNDAINWKLIGKAQRNHAPYLPGHPYRFWRFAVYLQILPDERYSSLILDVIEKYQKL